MNIPQSISLTELQAKQLLTKAKELDLSVTYNPEKHQLILEKGQDWLGKLFLSWTWIWQKEVGLDKNQDSHFVLIVIKAGQAAVGYFHQGILLDHRVFRAYMIRQKQGFSQIKYLKTKGKSRAGSRIRLSETERFFEEINERLSEYDSLYPIDFWGISCGKTLWPFLFDSNSKPPFSNKSTKLIEVPIHLPQATLENLEKAGKMLNTFHLLFADGRNELKLFVDQKPDSGEGDENW